MNGRGVLVTGAGSVIGRGAGGDDLVRAVGGMTAA